MEKDKQTFIADYLTKHMANHNLPYSGAYFNLLADTEFKAEKAWKRYCIKKEINVK